jgi:hypothetical protein
MPAFSRLEDRAILKTVGPDAPSFLQGLVSLDIGALKAFGFGALLSPQGKILAEFILAPIDDGFLLDCHRSVAEALLKRLALYRLRAAVEISRLEGWAAGVADETKGADGLVAGADPRLAALGARAYGPAAAFASPSSDFDRRRIASGVPELGPDFGPDELFLLDVNADALNGVSYKKGCFVGQEVTSRMKRKGEVRRRTLIARFDGAPPRKGASVVAGDSMLGEIMSGAPGVALAAIRLDRFAAARAAGEDISADGKKLQLAVPDYLERA